MPYDKLKDLLYTEILKHEYSKTKNVEIAKKSMLTILGFCTSNNNLKLDYMISVNEGELTQSLLLECFYASKKTNRILNYEIYNCLAIGGFSKVYLARSKEDGKFCVMKFIMKQESEGNFN